MLRIIVLTFFAATALATSTINHDGPCSTLTPVPNFNLTAYQGVWYEISKFPTVHETGGKCGQAEYKLEDDIVKVKNTHILNGVQTSIEGTAKLAADANNAGKVIVSFKFGEIVSESPLFILTTDYNNYAVAASCKYDDKKKTHNDNLWVLSRTKKLEGDAKKTVDEFLKSLKEIDITKLVETDFSEEACKFTSTGQVTKPQ